MTFDTKEVGPGAYAMTREQRLELREEFRDVENDPMVMPAQLELPFPITVPSAPYDPVNRPQHYADSSVETIEAIESWGLGYRLGNVIKYVSRAGKKDPAKRLEDLKKAAWYLAREIEMSK